VTTNSVRLLNDLIGRLEESLGNRQAESLGGLARDDDENLKGRTQESASEVRADIGLQLDV
jgi:hypothetical protein